MGGRTVTDAGLGLGAVELRVQENGEDVLVYAFRAIDEAAEMFDFLRDFFPGAKFIIQPLMH